MRLIILLFCFFVALPVAAEERHGIAAVVNEDIITMLEVQERLRLALATTGLPDSQQVRRQLLPRIIQNLVDESLQEQEAKRFSIAVSPDEIDGMIAGLEKERGRPPGSLVGFMASKGVPERTLRDQIEAQIAWSKLAGRKIRKEVKVGGEEIDREIERRMSPDARKEELLIASMVLPVDSPESEPATRELAKRLRKEIDAGASFEALASQLTTAQANAVEPTWVDASQLEPAVAAALDRTPIPGYVGPLRTPLGYQILQVKEKRESKLEAVKDSEMAFKRIKLSLTYDAQLKEVDVLMDIAKQVAKNPGVCAEKNVAGLQDLEGLNISVDYERTRLSAIAPELRDLVENLTVGQVAEPFATNEGIQLLMLCEKTVLPTPKPDREKVRQQIFRQKLELAAQKYMRDLRRSAFVDIRLGRKAG